MGSYVLRRLSLIPLLIFGITLLDFTFINLTPGDPVSAMIDPQELRVLDPEAVEARREALGLNKPILVRYGIWIKELAQGNLGYSIVKAQSVGQLMSDGVRNTLVLMAFSLVISTMIGIGFGIVSALKPYSSLDFVLTALAFAGIGMPSFFFSLVLMRVGALGLGWFPTSGLVTPGADHSLQDRALHLVLPMLALSVNGCAGIMRYMRSSLIEVLNEDYVTTARAKGLRETIVVMRHAVRNALLPIITILGLEIPGLFGGAVIIESIFAIPGIGTTLVDAMRMKDYPVIMGGIFVSGLLVLFSTLIADLAYAVVDPRIRYGR